MSDQQSPHPVAGDPGALAHLRGLLDVAHAMRERGGLEPVLEAIARAVANSLGWRVVVVNLHRPAFDDFEVRVVHGASEAGRATLMGTTNPRAAWERCSTRASPATAPTWSATRTTSGATR